jgi:phage-related minor tail protein
MSGDIGVDESNLLEQSESRMQELERGADRFARAMSQAFVRAAVDGRKFEDVLKSLVLRLSQMSLNTALRAVGQELAGGLSSLFKGLLSAGTSNTAASSTAARFARGGVIATPTYFPLGARGVGLAGEAGPEAILPLARAADASLGVSAGGGGSQTSVTIHIATPDAESFRRSEAYLAGQIARAVARGQRAL